MSFIIFIGLGLGTIALGLRSAEEIFQLLGAALGIMLDRKLRKSF